MVLRPGRGDGAGVGIQAQQAAVVATGQVNVSGWEPIPEFQFDGLKVLV